MSSPAQIFRDLQSSGLPNARCVTQKQVFYQWQRGNVSLWRRDVCPMASASKLLMEFPSYEHQIFEIGGLRGLAIFVTPSIQELSANAQELVMDATYGTNSAGMSLFSVLTEVDGCGIPLAYCFVQVVPRADGTAPCAEPSAMGQLLVSFLKPLQGAGIEPTFFGTDKDFAEIGAVHMCGPIPSLSSVSGTPSDRFEPR